MFVEFWEGCDWVVCCGIIGVVIGFGYYLFWLDVELIGGDFEIGYLCCEDILFLLFGGGKIGDEFWM